MIFFSQNQFCVSLIFLLFGFIAQLIIDIFFVIFLKKYAKILKNIILDAVFYTFYALFFIFLINFFNFGLFNIVLLLVYLLGSIWSQKSRGKIFVFCGNVWYNTINNYLNERKEKKDERKKKSKTNHTRKFTSRGGTNRNQHFSPSKN